jgi:hypothetical protein
MTPTFYGVLVLMIGVFLMTRSMIWMLALFLFATLFGGASAIDLPLLGGASVQPSFLVLVLLGVRLVLAKSVTPRSTGVALRENALLLAYCVYAAVTAFILPRMFSHRLAVMPMATAYLGAQPLEFTSQNITTAFYLVGTGFAAVAAAIIAQDERSRRILVATMIVMTWAHILFGLADLGLSTVHQEKLLLVFRNAHYAMLDQTMMSSVHRIAGIMPEPSAYASYGCVMLALMTELWMRGVAAKMTGIAALAMLTLIILSTSSSGYVTVGAYGFIILVRILFIRGASSTAKAATFGTLALIGAGVAVGVLIFEPKVGEGVGEILSEVILTKAQSSSGVERATWARQGLDAFAVSGGFGVGAGSFRSSGMFTAILGSVGVIGISLFLGYLLQVMKPLRPSTYRVSIVAPRSLGAAAAWGALVSILTAALGSPSPDPGAMFAVLAGLSLAWSVPPAPVASRSREGEGVPAYLARPNLASVGGSR